MKSLSRIPPSLAEPPPRRNPALLLGLYEFLLRAEKVSWAVDGLLKSGGTSLLCAKPKVGKSVMVQCLAVAAARGEDFLGRKTQQGAVLYFASTEADEEEVRNHFEKLGLKAGDPLYIHCDSSGKDAIHKIECTIEKYKPVLVIIDSLVKYLHVKEWNSYSEMSNTLEPLAALARKTGVHICATSHFVKADRADVS